jgi:hypothetical protein
MACGCLCIAAFIPLGLEWFNEFCSYLLDYLCLWVIQILTFIATQKMIFSKTSLTVLIAFKDPPPPMLQSLKSKP